MISDEPFTWKTLYLDCIYLNNKSCKVNNPLNVVSRPTIPTYYLHILTTHIWIPCKKREIQKYS